MRPHFDSNLIGELRNRVIQHNQAHPSAPVKLQELRKLYSSAHQGRTPGVTAMAKIDSHLLAKAARDGFDEAEHPRDDDGKFQAKGGGGASAASAPSPSLSVALPKTQREHEKLTEQNAGYAALQAAIIPETRYREAAVSIRDGTSAVAAIGLVTSLARGKENGLVARAARWAGGQTGKLAAGIGVGVAARGATTATSGLAAGADLVARLARSRAAGAFATKLRAGAAAREASARSSTLAGAELGRKAGALAGDFVAGAASRSVRFLGDAAASGGATPRAQAVRRGAMMVALAIPTALVIKRTWKGSVLDPEPFAQSIDATSYRRIQKVAAGDDLAKAVPRVPGMWSGGGRLVLAGLAGIGGALAGGAGGAAAGLGVGELVGRKRGNPYRDEDGKFSSAANARNGAVAGAVLGGAAAALGTYAMLRGGNAKLVQGAARKAKDAFDRRLSLTNTRLGQGGVKRLLATRDTVLDEAVQQNPQFKAARDAMERYGASTDLHYKRRIADEVNEKIGSIAAFWDEFKVPDKAGKTWRSVADIKAGIPQRNLKDTRAASEIKAFAERATPAQFKQAIKDLAPEQQTTALHWFEGRSGWVNGVDDQITAHFGKIKTAEDTVAQTAAAWGEAQTAETSAKAILARTTGLEAVHAAEAAVETASVATAKAAELNAKASTTALKLKDAGAGIVSPITGKKIPAASAMDQAVIISDISAKARDKAARVFDATVAETRGKQAQMIAERANRNLGALAVMSEAHGVPRGAKSATAKVAALHREVRGLQRKASQVQRELQTVRDARAALRGRNIDPTVRADLDSRVSAATASWDEVSGELALARARRASAVTDYQNALDNPAPGSRIRLMPESLAADIRQDLRQATAQMTGAARDFLQRPTMQRLAAFAADKTALARAGATDLAHELFFTPDGKGGFSPSWIKTTRNIGLIGLAGDGAKDLFNWGKDRVLGPEDGKTPAPFPRGLSIETDTNALTGASFSALTAPHPTEKGERIVVYGERQDSTNGQVRPIVSGGKMSQVKGALRDGRWERPEGGGGGGGGGGALDTGDLHNLPQAVKDMVKSALSEIGKAGAIVRENIPGAGDVRVAYLKMGSDAKGASQPVRQHIENLYLTPDKKGGDDQRTYFHALKSLFANEAQVLTPQQRYVLLTNRAKANEVPRNHHSIFPNAADFNTDDRGAIARALTSEMDRALRFNPNREEKANLHRAAHIVGVQKGLSPETMLGIHKKIAGQSQGGEQRQGNPGQGDAGPSVRDNVRKSASQPKDWDDEEFENLTAGHANRFGRSLTNNWPGSNRDVQNVVKVLASHVGRVHGLGLQDSVTVAANALNAFAGSSQESRRNAADHIKEGHWETDAALYDSLDAEARKLKRAARVEKLDDIDDLIKAFDSTKHQRHGAGSSEGGEFAPAGGGSAGAPRQPTQRRQTPGRAAMVRHARPKPVAAAPKPVAAAPMGSLHPVRISGELGYNAGMEAASEIASRFLGAVAGKKADIVTTEVSAIAGERLAEQGAHHLAGKQAVVGVANKLASKVAAGFPAGAAMSIAERFLPGPAQIVSAGVKLAAAAVGGAVGNFAGDAAARAAYRVAGKPVPERVEEEFSLGRMAAETGGQIVGSTIGGIAGGFAGGVGAFAGGVAGSWAGAELGRAAHSWFTGYDPNAVQRAMTRFSGPAE